MTGPDPAQRLPEAYAALAHRFAGAGDLRMAQLAAWAGDVHVLEELLWESGLAQAPDPAAELSAVGESVAAAIEDVARALPDAPLTARGVVEVAREALVQTFDESVHGLVADRLGDLDLLDECRPAPGTSREERVAARLGGRSVEALAAELRTAAADCATMADLLAADGELAAARRLGAQADAAAFEAYLLTGALAAGDATLATVELRWELAAAEHERGPTAVLGTMEQEGFSRTLGAGAGT